MKKNDMNLLERYQEIHKERTNRFSASRIYIVILVGTLLILSALTVQFWLTENGLKSDITTLRQYNESAQVKTKMAEIAVLKENVKSLDTMLAEVKSINAVFDSAVRFNSYTLDVLYSTLPSNVKFTAITYSEGVVKVDVSGTRPSDFSNYTLRLINEAYFKSVTYTGYSFDDGATIYNATIECVMKGGN